jgi:hypothetical protein
VHEFGGEFHRLALKAAPDRFLHRGDDGHRLEAVLGVGDRSRR